ncbi:MAG: hypothetical protein LW875_07860 [Proteobacteria bacterium]|jgi:hypothetical protein|nr:hypothetical protein [Pseudomonadota bacterium]
MIKSAVLALCLTFAVGAQATNVNQVALGLSQSVLSEVDAQNMNWKVGDSASYNMKGGFINGKMVMTIKSITGNEVVINQNLDLGFLGKQDCDATIDASNGQTKKLVCNGQEQQAPSQGDIEVVDIKDDKITVPAGTFECLHIIAKNTKDNSEINQWANPKLVPVSGLIKAVTPSQIGTMTVELTSFKKN